MRDSTRDLNSGPVGRQLLRVSAPMSLGILGILAVGLSDAYFLARVGPTELAAIGFVYPVIVAINGFSVGMSAGANAALSQALGRGSGESSVARLALHATVFGLLLGLCVGGVFHASSAALFALLGAKGAVLDAALAYAPWWALSFPVLLATVILNAVFRSAGDGITPSAIMVLTAALNIALSPALIFGVGPIGAQGMAGAGIATLAARLVAFGLALWLAVRRGRLDAGPHPMQGVSRSVRVIVSVGLPASASRAINPAGMAMVIAAVATLGDQAVAGFGAAARVQALALVPFLALSIGLAPVIGQAWGADLHNRAERAMRLALWFVAIYGAALGVALWTFADPLAAVMTARGEAATYTAQYLRIVGWSLGGYGAVLAVNAALTARSQAVWALGVSLGRVGLLYVPLALAGVVVMGYDGILIAAVIANVAAAWGSLVVAQANGLLHTRVRTIATPSRKLGMMKRLLHGP